MKLRKKEIRGRFILLLTFLLTTAFGAYAQNVVVKGNIKDPEGNPVSGATVRVENVANEGAISDDSGNFSLSVPEGTKHLVVSHVGMLQKQVDVIAGQILNVVLEPEDKKLDEVVVIGYQTMKRKDLTGAIASVSGKDISSIPVSNAAQALQGKLPGVNVVSYRKKVFNETVFLCWEENMMAATAQYNLKQISGDGQPRK